MIMTPWKKAVTDGILKVGSICLGVALIGYITVRGFTYLNCLSNCQAMVNTSPIFKDAYEPCASGCQFFNVGNFIVISVFVYLPVSILAGTFAGYVTWIRSRHRRGRVG